MFAEAEKMLEALGESRIMVLATASEGRVTARSMSVIIFGGNFYFQTDRELLKYAQICDNPQVALCWNNYQIEGFCRELGHPLLPRNAQLTAKYRASYPGSFDAYSHLQNESFFEVKPSFITVWSYENTLPYREFYDFGAEKYYREDYRPKNNLNNPCIS